MLTLHYQEYGDQDAPLMIFLHGGGVSSWMWDRQVDYFTKYHCVTVDLPEQGKSSQDTEFSINTSATKVIELIENIATGKQVIAIGFSLGSQVLMQMLSIQPNLIDYAIINSVSVRPFKIAKRFIQPLITLSFPLIKNKYFSKLQAKELYIGFDYFDQYYEETCRMKRETLVRILKENMSFAIPSEFYKATGKILVTVGAKEKRMMKKSVFDILNNNRNCTGVMIANIGHGLPLAEPDLFNQMIENWLHSEPLPEACNLIE